MTFQDDSGNILEVAGQFAMTKQAVSFFNGQIKGDVSLNFNVDNNSVNREVLNYDGPQMLNQVAFTKQPFTRIRNGNVLDHGFIVIQAEEEDFLNCFYVSGNSNWVQLLQGLITELDYTGILGGNYLTLLDSATIFGSRTSTSGVVFPTLDWCYALNKGNNVWAAAKLYDSGQSNENSFTEYLPCLYLHTLIEEICRQNGIKITGNILNDALYKAMIISPPNGQIKRDYVKILRALGSSYTITSTVSPGIVYTSPNGVSNAFGSIVSGVYTALKNSAVVITIEIPTSSATGTMTFVIGGTNSLTGNAYVSPGATFNTTYQVNLTMTIGQTFWISFFKSGGTASVTANIKVTIPELITIGDYVSPSDFLPGITSIDVVKYLINRWGCVASFDQYSKTIKINILENIKTENALDWSEYYQSHRSEYTVDTGANNYIKLQQPEGDTIINRYNKNNSLDYGNGNITTRNTLKNSQDVLELPFSPSSYGFSTGGVWLANVPLVNLVDSDPLTYSSRSSAGSTPNRNQYTLSDPTIIFVIGEVVRIVDDIEGNIGYFYSTGNSTGSITVQSDLSPNTATGKIYKQTVEFIQSNSRELFYRVNGTDTEISDKQNYTVDELFARTLPGFENNVSPAWFSKPSTGFPIDNVKANLAFGDIDGTFTDPNFKELYFNKISKFIQNPTIRAKMILPESVYQGFDFTNFIYLKTEKLTGYFFVQSIVNYVDSNTPVEVNLYML